MRPYGEDMNTTIDAVAQKILASAITSIGRYDYSVEATLEGYDLVLTKPVGGVERVTLTTGIRGRATGRLYITTTGSRFACR